MAKRYWIAWVSWEEKRVRSSLEESQKLVCWDALGSSAESTGSRCGAEGLTQVTAFSCFRCWLLQHKWCNTAEIYSITSLRPAVSNLSHWTENPKVFQVSALSTSSRSKSVPCLFPAAGGFQDPLACGHITQSLPPWSHCLFLLCLCQNSLHLPLMLLAFRAHPGNPGQSPHVILIIPAKIPFSDKVIFTGSRDRDLISFRLLWNPSYTESGSIMLTPFIYDRRTRLWTSGQQKRTFLFSRHGKKYYNQCLAEQTLKGRA